MALKTRITEEEFSALPEALQESYEKPEGSAEYLLRFEGKPAGYDEKVRIDEFRNNNLEKDKTITELQGKLKAFDGIDAEEVISLLEKEQENKNKKLLDEGKVEELFVNRTEKLVKDHENQVEKLKETLESKTQEANALNEKLSVEIINNAIVTAINEHAQPAEHALSDIISRARDVWLLNEKGEPEARNSNGELIYSKDGRSPLEMDEWAMELTKQAPHLFDKSFGGGSTNKTSKQHSNNPYTKDNWNMTRQAILEKADVATANKMRVEAGLHALS